MDEVVYLDEDTDLVDFPDEKDLRAYEKIKDKFSCIMCQDPETGWLKISPVNDENCIIIHGAEEAEFFTKNLLDHFR